MTTPRDAIAGLSERLQSQGSHTMTRGELIATIIALPFCIIIFVWVSSTVVESRTPQPAATWADDGGASSSASD